MSVRSERPPRTRATRLRAFVSDFSLPIRVVTGGAGLGLSLAGLKLRGVIGLPLGILGVILFARVLAQSVRRAEATAVPPIPRDEPIAKATAKPFATVHAGAPR